MKNSALETVQNFQQSLAAGTDSWKKLFADDILFTGPVDMVKGKDANIKLNESFMPLVKNYVPQSMISQGNKVVMEGVYTVNTPTGKSIDLPTAEIYQVDEGLISNIRIYYDAEEFRKEFAAEKC